MQAALAYQSRGRPAARSTLANSEMAVLCYTHVTLHRGVNGRVYPVRRIISLRLIICQYVKCIKTNT